MPLINVDVRWDECVDQQARKSLETLILCARRSAGYLPPDLRQSMTLATDSVVAGFYLSRIDEPPTEPLCDQEYRRWLAAREKVAEVPE